MDNSTTLRPLALGVSDAAFVLGVSKFTIRNWFYKGLIKGTKLGTRLVFPLPELERIASEGLSVLTEERVA